LTLENFPNDQDKSSITPAVSETISEDSLYPASNPIEALPAS
jgi:hypothetical protein